MLLINNPGVNRNEYKINVRPISKFEINFEKNKNPFGNLVVVELYSFRFKDQLIFQFSDILNLWL